MNVDKMRRNLARNVSDEIFFNINLMDDAEISWTIVHKKVVWFGRMMELKHGRVIEILISQYADFNLPISHVTLTCRQRFILRAAG